MVSADGRSTVSVGNGITDIRGGTAFSGGITISNNGVSLILTTRVQTTSASTTVNTFSVVQSSNGANGTLDKGVLSGVSLNGSGTRNVNALANGKLTTPSSDRRLKQDIEPLGLGLNLIEKLEPKKFAFKSSPEEIEYGLIAQEVKEIADLIGIEANSNLVYEDSSEDKLSQLPPGEEGPVLGVEYMKLIPILINSVKELQERVKFLEKERDNK
jgi:hypothetical protein